jgi:hypothetical protein
MGAGFARPKPFTIHPSPFTKKGKVKPWQINEIIMKS